MLDISKDQTCFCEQIHKGKFGLKIHDPNPKMTTWKGGIQLELTFKVKRVGVVLSSFNLLKLAKWVSDTTPSNIFPPIKTYSNLESSPKLWGRVPLNWLVERSKNLKDESFPIEIGIGAQIELPPKESVVRFWNCLSCLTIYGVMVFFVVLKW